MATPSVKRWASGASKGGPAVKRWAQDAHEKIVGRVNESAYKPGADANRSPNGPARMKASDDSYAADYATNRLRQSYFGSATQLKDDHAAAAKLHQKAAAHYVKEAAGNLSPENGPSVAFAQSKIAHETGTADDHALAAKYHADQAQRLRQAAQDFRADASGIPGNRLDQELRETADRFDEKAKDHEERAADHQGLAGGSGKWEHEGASEKPLPEVYRSLGSGSLRSMHNVDEIKGHLEKEGKEQIDRANVAIGKAARHQELRDRHAHEAKSAEPRTASGWDEEKHPRDDQGRFT